MSKGRPRQFDISTALEQAMLVFWEKGYRGASLDDLTEAMQINRPSLYATFGLKEDLFMAVINHYLETRLQPHSLKLLQATDLNAGLTLYIESIGRLICGGSNPPGCLIACVLSEDCCSSEVIRQKLANIICSTDLAFTVLFERHQDKLRDGLTPILAAQLLTSTLHGLSIRARTGATPAEINKIAKASMSTMIPTYSI